jgi:hypothetical protein
MAEAEVAVSEEEDREDIEKLLLHFALRYTCLLSTLEYQQRIISPAIGRGDPLPLNNHP